MPATAGLGPELPERGATAGAPTGGYAGGGGTNPAAGAVPSKRAARWARSKPRRERRGCSCRRAACRKCDRMRRRQYRCVWRSSYEPPVRGHRHYRQIVYRWTQRSAGQNEMVLALAVIAILLLLGLLCCVVLVVFLLGRAWLGGGDVALEFVHARLHLIDEPDIVVVADDAGLRIVERMPQSGRTQADLAQIGGLNAEDAQGPPKGGER